MPEPVAVRSIFDISWAAIAKVIVAIVLVWMWLKLWLLAMVMLISILIAVAIDPIVRWLEARRIPRWLGSVGCILLLAARRHSAADGGVVVDYAARPPDRAEP